MSDQEVLFVDAFKTKDFKNLLGVASIVHDHDRVSYDFDGPREQSYRYDVVKKGEIPFFFLLITYQPDFQIAESYGIVNQRNLDADIEEGVFKRKLVRQVRVSTGTNEGYVLYSYEPDFGSVEQMVDWLPKFVESLKAKWKKK